MIAQIYSYLCIQDEEDGDLERSALRRQLEAVQRQAEEYKQQLRAKEEEAEKFRKQLSQIQTTTDVKDVDSS